MRLKPFIYLVMLWFLQSSWLTACPVCFSSDGKTLAAFQWMTLLLTLMPFLIIGSLIYWIRKRFREQSQEAQEGNIYGQ